MKKNFFLHSRKAYTLIELLLYTGLLAVILSIVSYFLFTSTSAKVKNRTISETEQQGEAAMTIITQAIRNSASINSPATGTNSATLLINVADGTKNPTIFSLSSGTIKSQEGANPTVDLTTSKVVVSNLLFENLSRPSTPGIIKISFTIAYNAPNNRNEYQYSKVFYNSASRR